MDYFPSLRAFQNAHRALLQRYRAAGKVTPELESDLEQLLRLGSETGRILDTLSDQRAAQGLLDYWSTVLSRERSDSAEFLLKDFDPNAEPELADAKCPYVGLHSVQTDQSSLFSGRENLIREMLDRLRNGNLLAVIGPPGSGRSSLVYAGLLPALAHGQLLGSGGWPVKRITPPLTDQLAATEPEPTSVSVVDNCDDLFALGSENERNAFASDVLALVDKPGVRRIVVLILHSDYEQLLVGQPELIERIKSSNVQVTSPSAKDLRDAIERPADLVGLKFDEDVVDGIVHEILGERTAFTLLQFTMRRLWTRRTHNRITFKTFQEAGAGRAAVVRAMQAFYEGLSPDQQQLLHPILVRLCSVPDSVASTRRMLVEASADPGEADNLLNALLDAELISVSMRKVGESALNEQVIRPVHESLKDWNVLSEWIKQEKSQLEYLGRLEQKANEWVLSRRSKYGLLSEFEYLQAKAWLNDPQGSKSGASDNVRQFMEASRRRHRREVRKLWLGLTGMAAVSVVITVLAVFYWMQRGEAALQRDEASHQRDEASRQRDEASRQRDEAARQRDEAARQRDLAVLQVELRRVGDFDSKISALEKTSESEKIFIQQLEASAAKAREERAPRAIELGKDVAIYKKINATTRQQIAVLAEDRNHAILKIVEGNTTRWNKELDDAQRARIIENALQTISGNELGDHSRFQIAMFAVAAIPQSVSRLNEALRNAILKYRLRNQFSPPGARQVWAVAFNPRNANKAAVGDELGGIWLWDPLAKASAAHKEFAEAGDVVNSLAYSADGSFLAAAYRTSGAVVWQLAANEETNEEKCAIRAPEPPGNTYSVAFAPDGKALAVAAGHSVQLWDLTRPECPALPQVFTQDDEIFSVAFSPVHNLLATASGSGVVAVWNLDNPAQPLRTFPAAPSARNPMLAVSFSPTGKALVAASGANGQGYIWDVETGEQTAELPAKGGPVGQIAFSTDGTLVVATSGANGSAVVSDARTAEVLYELDGGGRSLMFGASFSPDAKYLLTSNLDGSARLWDVGKIEVAVSDREGLIALGARQTFSNMNLTQDECEKLRAMDIPIFRLADRGYENERNFICPLPFLWQRPGGPTEGRIPQ